MGHRPVFGDIADDIRRMILCRELVAGAATPPDDALSTTYNVSVMTIRRAMEILEAEGLLRRTRGRWIVRRAETITCLHRVLDALDVGDAPDPDDMRTLAGLVIGLWTKRRVPYEPTRTPATAITATITAATTTAVASDADGRSDHALEPQDATESSSG